MNKNKKSFIATLVIFALVIVAVIVATRYAWNRQSATYGADANVPTAMTGTEPRLNTGAIGMKFGKLYEDSNLSLQYPEDWMQYKEADQPQWVFFKSPDHVPVEAKVPGLGVAAGYWLEVFVAPSEESGRSSYEQDLQNTPRAQEAHGGSYETIQIDGHSAVLSNISSHGGYWHATAYAGGKAYLFRLNAPDANKPEVKELLKVILATVKIK